MVYTHEKYRNLRRATNLLFGILIVLPLAPIINRYIPPLVVGSWNFDLVMSIILATVFAVVVVRIFRFLLIPLLVIFVGVILYSQLSNGRGFSGVISDYQGMVKTNWGKKEQKETDLILTPSFFDGPLTRTVKSLQGKVDYQDSVVRNFAVKHSLDNFNEYYPKYGIMVRNLSLFKYINNNFRYVSDSQRDEYFATARETILNGMGGDCDDHSILMVSALKSIGARCRMVLTEGHLYPELYCGDAKSFGKYNAAILNLFSKEVKGNIYYHEYDGEYWINLDYSAEHPGGPYVSEKAFAIIDL
jgi:transglutaminase-like putative cysteine protease